MTKKISRDTAYAALALAVGLVAAGQASGLQAQTKASSPAAPAYQAQTYDFDIAGGPLDQVLLGISRQSGVNVSFSQTLVQGVGSQPVHGVLTVEQALRQALHGASLEAVPGEGGWVLRRTAASPSNSSASSQRPQVPGDVELERVTVTGSRIPRAQNEGPSPVTVISSQEIAARGYRNVYDAVASQTQNTGMTQGEDYGNTFQPAASALNLRGLGPNHTLVLINGRRVADYPTAYGGSVNFTNLANIPSMMIERIEILSSGASAVYGSDAIAGVVNIILKDKTQGVDVNLRGGYVERGGGDNQRLQITGGDSWGDFDGIFGLELTKRQPIWGNQRDFMDRSAQRDVGYRRNLSTGQYLGPGCAGYGGIFNGQLTGSGGRCTTDQYYNDYWTLQTQKENYDGYTRGTWHFSDTGKVFADLMFGFDHTQNNTRGPSFTSPDFINQNTGDLERWYRSFASEEIGGKSTNNSKWREVSWTGTLGLEDSIGDSGWSYQVAANRSEYISNRTTRYTPLSSISDFYLGPQLGTQDGYPVYAPDASRLDRPLSEDEWQRLRGSLVQKSKSVSQTFSASLNGELFDLPAGPVGFAGVAEVGKQSYQVNVDDGLSDGSFYATSPASDAGGSRDRYATGAELSIPINDSLLASAAGRWDQYRFSGRTEQQKTYNLGLEWRPVSSLLVRGSYGTSFRAPDLNYLYQADTNGYTPAQVDYYGCRQGVESACERGRVDYTQSGTPDLASERGKSWTYGFVWSPSSQFDFSADYWRVQIDDLLTTLDINRLLQQEDQCLTGQLDSSTCQQVLARIQRNAGSAAVDPNRLQRVQINAINAASERVSGLDLRSNIRWGAGRYGAFSSSLGYSLVLSHYYKESQEAETDNLRSSSNNYDWRSKVNASLTWDYQDFTATLLGVRYGSVTNSAGDGRLTPWTTFNASARYRLNKQATVGLTVNNVLDKVKKDDSAGWPNYPTGNYDPYGRQVWLDVSYHFGG
ncbi:TonB-dependent outermembrane receptor [Pseudomonas sp. StFLB209]|uniref:TonB-dependent receptor n=1 Tax=Pseudomonas sp. StFLB209 TaxID=1028989 RepID=UPI0004F60B24|nr:TonB-dependent receptor [Pseudomonas sp. StFLB209]BAP45398.1 TonB-dependent outermembrane receptor [Pseudomonas sp. StFLB209]